MSGIELQKIKVVLKEQLKKQKMTYEDLAEEMEVSVPTIKRWMGEADLGLNDLLKICNVLNLNLAEIQALVDQSSKSKTNRELTEEQQQFLAKNMNYYAYFMKINDGLTPQQIADKYGLTKLATDKYLVKLEKLGMIRVTGKLRVKSAFDGDLSLGHGILAKTYFSRFIHGTADFFEKVIGDEINRERQLSSAEKKDGQEATFGLSRIRLTNESYEKWIKEHNKALRDLETISRIEEKAYDEKELLTVIVGNSHCALRHTHPALDTLDHIFGKITNI